RRRIEPMEEDEGIDRPLELVDAARLGRGMDAEDRLNELFVPAVLQQKARTLDVREQRDLLVPALHVVSHLHDRAKDAPFPIRERDLHLALVEGDDVTALRVLNAELADFAKEPQRFGEGLSFEPAVPRIIEQLLNAAIRELSLAADARPNEL